MPLPAYEFTVVVQRRAVATAGRIRSRQVGGHAAPPSLAWPLPDAVISATSWLTLRRDRPNRSAMAR